MDTSAFKLLGNVNTNSLIEKINIILDKGWDQYCYDPGPPWNVMNKIQSLDMIFLFTVPEKENIILQNLIYNKELLNLFKDEIQTVNNIFNQYYTNHSPKRINLSNMRAHSVIPEHVDFRDHYEHTIRIHIPIITNEKVIFQFPTVNTSLHMKAGEVIEFNNNIPHSGVNNSEENRIHLIIDYGNNDDPYYENLNYNWTDYLD